MSLRLTELHAIYQSVSPEEARLIANLGAEVYVTVREQLRAAWTSEMSVEEEVKATMWRREGRLSALGEVGEQLTAAEEARARLTVAEGTVSALRSAMETEISRRVGEMVAIRRTEFELLKREEIHALEKQLAEVRGQAKMTAMLEEAHVSLKESQRDMRETIAALEGEVEKYKAATSTKSSHALGKIGEAAMFEMLNSYVLPRFPYSEVRDVSKMSHVGDFHLWVHGPTGKRIKVMIDVKKYATPIQHKETEKLYSDLDGDDSHAGIMISIDSAIYSKAQFQIGKSKNGKPCMFLTFEKLDDGIRQEVLCWAVRVLIGVVALNGTSDQDSLIASAKAFIGEMNEAIRDLDGCVRTTKNLHDTLRKMKDRITDRISEYTVSIGSVPTDVIEHVPVDTKCTKVLRNGERCKTLRLATGLYCRRHEDAAEGT